MNNIRMKASAWIGGLALLALILSIRMLAPAHSLHRAEALLHTVHLTAVRRLASGRAKNGASGDEQKLYSGKVAVLMWHHIDPSVRGGDIITPKQFTSQLDYLRDKGIHFITLQQFRDFKERGAAVPDNAALVTFDDGYESFYKYAYPILKQRSIGGVCFVITGDMNPKTRVYTPHMTAKEISAMVKDDPQIEVQAHTDALHYKVDRGHDALTAHLVSKGVKETPTQYKQRIEADTARCVQTLQKLNLHPIDTFAYPYGLSNTTAEQVLLKAGIRFAFTVSPGLVAPDTDQMLMPRINGGSPSVSAKKLYAAIDRSTHGEPTLVDRMERSFLALVA